MTTPEQYWWPERLTPPCACTRREWCAVHRDVLTPTEAARRGRVEHRRTRREPEYAELQGTPEAP